MGDIVTKTKLENASVDCQTLEDCINGPADTKVLSRLGRYYWTLATIDSKVNSVVIQSNIAISQINSQNNNVDAQASSAIASINNSKNSAQGALTDAINDFNSQGNSALNDLHGAINTIVIDDGVPAIVVSTANGTNQQQVNDLGGVDFWTARTYQKNNEVRLTDGTIVFSTIPSNINNPNLNMIGWKRKSDADLILDASGKTAQQLFDNGIPEWRSKAIGYDLHAEAMRDDGVVVKSLISENTNNPNLNMAGWGFDTRFVTLSMFGASKTGDSTVAINKALAWSAANNQIVYGDGWIYNVSKTVDRPGMNAFGDATTFPVAVVVPDGAKIDFKNSTLRTPSGTRVVAICNNSLTDQTDVIEVYNLNTDSQGGSTVSWGESVLFYGLQKGSRIENIRTKNFHGIGVGLYANTGAFHKNIYGESGIGNAINYGGNTHYRNKFCIQDGHIGGENLKIHPTSSGLPANPILIGASDCVFDTFVARNTGGGFKFTSFNNNNMVSKVKFSGAVFAGEVDNGTTNSGLKFQADNINELCSNITVGEVLCEDAKGAGLYYVNCDNIKIGTYLGLRNGIGLDGLEAPDIDFKTNANNCTISTATSGFAGQRGLACESAGSLSISRLKIYNNGQTSTNNNSIIVTNGSLSIDSIEIYDDQAISTIGSPIQVPSSATNETTITLGDCYFWKKSAGVKVPFTNSRPFSISKAVNFYAKSVKQGTGLQPLSDVVTLSKAQTIANENVSSLTVGAKSLYPMISFEALNNEARTSMRTVEIPAFFPIVGGIRQTQTLDTTVGAKCLYKVGDWSIRSEAQS